MLPPYDRKRYNNHVIARNPAGVTWQSPAKICRIVTLYREIATDFILAMTPKSETKPKQKGDCFRSLLFFYIREWMISKMTAKPRVIPPEISRKP